MMEKVKLGDIADLIMGQSPASDSYNQKGDGVPFYQGKSDFGKYYPTVRMYCNEPKKLAQKDDILMSVRAPIGDVNLSKEKCCIGRGLAAIRVKNDIDVMYVFYVLQHFKDDLAAQGTGSTFKAISRDILRDFEVPIYDLDRQKHISQIFSKIDRSLDNCEERLTTLDTLIKSRFVEMFGDPVINPKKWEKVELIKKCDITTGNTPSRKHQKYYGDKIEWIKSDNITSQAYLTQAVERLSEDGEKIGRTVEAGSILMTCIAGSLRSIGNVAIANRKVSFNQQINAISPKNENTWFMYVQFLLTKKYICSGVNMSLKGILSKGQLSKLNFIFPPIELQNQFAEFVQQVDQAKQSVSASIETLQTLKASLMQKYFH